MIELDESNFYSEIKNAAVIVDFYADWCGPCHKLSPILEEISKEIKKIKFAKLNVDNSEGIASNFGIMSIPTIILFKNGKEAGRVIGFFDEETLKEKFKEILGDLFA